jgi:glutaredoxin 3
MEKKMVESQTVNQASLTEPAVAYKPFNYNWAMEIAEAHEKIHWGVWEIKLQEDVDQWKKGTISKEEKNHITQILRLFTQSDVQVAQNYCDMFLPKFRNHEIRNMIMSFANREGTHQRAYAMLNDTLGFEDSEYQAFLEYKEMVDKLEFMQDNDVNTQQGIARALAQTCCNEGMSLFSAFAMLLNYQRFGKMKGMCEVVEWSIRDESMHVEGMSKLFRAFCNEHPRVVTDDFKKEVYDMFRTAVELEDKVIDLAYAMGDIEGLQKAEVKEYIRHLADRRLIQLGLKPNYGVKDNPLPWVEWIIAGDSFKNFFEGTVTDYSAAGMVGDWGW